MKWIGVLAVLFQVSYSVAGEPMMIVEPKYEALAEKTEQLDADRDRFGGWNAVSTTATGFFRAEKINDAWWLITPDGHGFLLRTATAMVFHGQKNHGGMTYKKAQTENYGTAEQWAEQLPGRLRQWGLNAIGNWSDPELFTQKFPYLYILSVSFRVNAIPASEVGVQGTFKVSDPYDPAFRAQLSKVIAEEVVPRKDDPYLIGWSVGNETHWTGFHHQGYRVFPVLQIMLRASHGRAGHRAAVDFLENKYEGDFAACSMVWDIPSVDSFEALRKKQVLIIPKNIESASSDCSGFLYQTVSLYSKIVSEEIRKADPNHLLLSDRMAGAVSVYEPVVRAYSEYFDVLCFNEYKPAFPIQHFEYYASLVDKPYLVTEFTYKAELKSATAGTAYRNPEQRAQAVSILLSELAASPYNIGWEWWRYVDIPPADESSWSGSIGNNGILKIDGTPHELLVETFRECATDAEMRHTGVRLPLPYDHRNLIVHPVETYDHLK